MTLKLKVNPGLVGPPNKLSIGTVTTGAAGSNAAAVITGDPPEQTLDLTIPPGSQGNPGPQGGPGPQGDKGWSPVFAVVADGARRVLQVADWQGGAGSKPATGKYVGLTGLVDAIADGVDVRGPAGSSSGDMTKAVYDANDDGKVTSAVTADTVIDRAINPFKLSLVTAAALSGNTTLTDADERKDIDCSGGAFTITLPAASAGRVGWKSGRIYNLTNSATITIARNGTPGTDAIEGGASLALPAGRWAVLECLATGVWRVAQGSRGATAAELRSKTAGAFAAVTELYSMLAVVTLTDAATIAWDMATGFDFQVTLGGNRTLGQPSNTSTLIGKKGFLRVIQDGTGSRTLGKHSDIKTPGGAAIALSSAAGAVDQFSYCIREANVVDLFPAGLAFA